MTWTGILFGIGVGLLIICIGELYKNSGGNNGK
jgi:hypothetical protein